MTTLIHDDLCSETKCRANFANLGDVIAPSVVDHLFSVKIFSVYDSCWAIDITDTRNCADGYEARAIKDVDAVTLYGADVNSNLTYFTCCKPEYNKDNELQRECNSNACPGRFVQCVAEPGGEGGLSIANEATPIGCNDDYFKHPNIVLEDFKPGLPGAYLTYNCCNKDDKSVESFISGCSPFPCAYNYLGCFAYVFHFGVFPYPIMCNSDRYKYPDLAFVDGRAIRYTCCEVYANDRPLSNISPGGYLRNNMFYLNTVPQLVLSIMAVLLMSLLLVSILIYKETRSQTYNLYIVLLAIPDLILNFVLILLITMVLMDQKVSFYGAYQLNLILNLSVLTINIWINTIISYEITRLVKASNQSSRIKPPSLLKVFLQCLPIYLFAIGIGVTLFKLNFENKFSAIDNKEESRDIMWAWIVTCIILPCGYLLYAIFQARKTKILSLTGRTRTLTFYFGRVILVFFIFMIPYAILRITHKPNLLRGVNSWKPAVMQYLVTIEGCVSALCCFNKKDIRKSFKMLYSKAFKLNTRPLEEERERE